MLSQVTVSRGYSLVVVHGLLAEMASLLQSTGSGVLGLSSCGLWALERGLQKVQHLGLVAPKHVDSSQTRNQTCDPCVRKWILNHWTTKEVLDFFLLFLVL